MLERHKLCYGSVMKALVEYMKVSGLNQLGLAKRLGVHQGQVNHWLQGRRVPSVANLKLIAEKTGISLENLARDL